MFIFISTRLHDFEVIDDGVVEPEVVEAVVVDAPVLGIGEREMYLNYLSARNYSINKLCQTYEDSDIGDRSWGNVFHAH